MEISYCLTASRCAFILKMQKLDLPAWALNKTSARTHTVDVVVDLSGVVQQPELVPSHHLPGLSIGQFVTADTRTHGVRRQKPDINRSSLYSFSWRRTHVTKWACPPTVSSSFSRKVMSLASPGRRHSSSWKRRSSASVSNTDTHTETGAFPNLQMNYNLSGLV